MSTNRTKDGGWARADKMERGPNGRYLCRWCRVEVKPPRITFCSDACVHEWKLRTDPGYARRKVEERDGGVCGRCSIDTEVWRKQRDLALGQVDADYLKLTAGYPPHGHGKIATWRDERRRQIGLLYWQLERQMTVAWKSPHFWEMDHIIPVIEGGGECGLENLRTLCIPCHRAVTKELAMRRSVIRRRAREAPVLAIPLEPKPAPPKPTIETAPDPNKAILEKLQRERDEFLGSRSKREAALGVQGFKRRDR